MKFGRKIIFILSLLVLCAGSIWGGLYHGVAQYFVSSALQGMGTAAYQALIQLTVSSRSLRHLDLKLTIQDFRHVLRSRTGPNGCNLHLLSATGIYPWLDIGRIHLRWNWLALVCPDCGHCLRTIFC